MHLDLGALAHRSKSIHPLLHQPHPLPKQLPWGEEKNEVKEKACVDAEIGLREFWGSAVYKGNCVKLLVVFMESPLLVRRDLAGRGPGQGYWCPKPSSHCALGPHFRLERR